MRLSIQLLFSLSLALPVLLAGCSTASPGPVAITKVNPFHLDTSKTPKTDDEMIKFEVRRHLHGVYQNVDEKERYGNYFTIFWKTETRQPATVRLEYRSAATGSQLHVKEVPVPDPKRRNVTKLSVVGHEYRTGGKVTQWKATVVEGDTVVAEYKSFLWKE